MKKILLLIIMVTASCTRQVTFMSYNIRNCNGMDDVNDINRVAAVLFDAAEYIAIQEADSMTNRSGNEYVLGKLAEITGMHATFAPAIDFDGGKYGIGLLSKTKPISHHTYKLPGHEEERVLLVAEFDNVYICTAHFSLTAEDRITSAKSILNILNQLDKPVLFAGDLNALPESEEIEILRNNMIPIVFGEKTWQADSPTESIDYIFGLGVSSVESKVIEEKVASDHRPIWAKVELQ